MVSLCHAYSYWINHLNEKKKLTKKSAIHVGLIGDKSFNYLIIYFATLFSRHENY